MRDLTILVIEDDETTRALLARKKLAEAGAPQDRIETVRGLGYRYRRAK